MSAIQSSTTDSALISDVLDGQQDQFQELIVRHEKMVYAVAWSQLGNVDLAEEAAQQTFVKAFSSLESLKDKNKFRSWLATIARNVSVSLGRIRRRELSNSARWIIEPIARPEGSFKERANLTDELRETLADLPGTHRQVLTLFYLEDQSIECVAETLNLSESAVKTRLNRARNFLRKELERRLGDSLSELAPANSLVLPVMATLSASTSLGSIAKLSLAGKIAAGSWAAVVSMISTIGGLVIAMIPAWLINVWISKQVAKDFREGESNDFRRELIRGRQSNMLFVLFAATMAISILFTGVGAHSSFFLIAVFCLWGIGKGVRHLRVNNSGLSRAAVACLVLWLVVAVAMGLVLMSGRYEVSRWGMLPIVIPMMLHFTILYRYRNQSPIRNDHNLFLRAATGGLTVDERSNDQPTIPEPKVDSVQLNSMQLESFAKFLGQHWLISDYDRLVGSIRLKLPAVRPAFSDAFFRSRKSVSTITIDSRGECELYFSPEDQTAIDQLPNNKVENPIPTLKSAIRESAHDFSQGDHACALRTLCAIEDIEIFKPEVRELMLQRQKRLFAITIAMSIFLILLWPATDWLGSYFGQE